MTLRTFLGDTILFNYTRDYGPGTQASYSMYSGYFMVTKILGESRCLRSDTGRRRAMRAGLDKIRVTQMYERMEGSGITTNHIKIGMNGHKVTRTLI